MNSIYLDIGNTSLVAAIKKDGIWEVIFKNRINELTSFIQEIKIRHSSSTLIVSSVRKDIIEFLKKELSGHSILLLSISDIPEKHLDYDTVKTLGPDRFIVCLGARKFSTKNVIVIDSGSATTIDLMDSEDIYRGGVIMPGLQILKNSFKDYLPELPLPEEGVPDIWPGKSTRDCIRWGVFGMYRDALLTVLNRYIESGEEFDIYINGGDAEKVLSLMNGAHDMLHKPYLLFDGMEEFVKQFKKC